MGKNINHIQHIKSNVVLNGKPKLPSSDVLVDGEIAINYAKGYETISTKNDSGDVVTFSSDNYYTEQKLGSGFTGENSAKTVTEVIDNISIGPVIDQVLDESTSASTNAVATQAVYNVIVDNELVWTNAYNTLSGSVSSHTSDESIHVTSSDKTNWNGKLDASNFNTYSGAVDTVLENKVDKVSGKGLSTNDFTTELKNKLDGIASGAEVNVQANWTETATTADSYILNKPTLGTAAAKGVSNGITNSDNLIESKYIYSGVGVTVAYDSETHYIQLKNTSGSVISSFDASSFLVDGMVDSVELETKSGTTYLVVRWNTAAGKTATELNIGDIFEADNYYSKSDLTGSSAVAVAKSLSASTAASADAVAWGGVSSKPDTATRWPSWDEVTSKPSTFTPASHTHVSSDITAMTSYSKASTASAIETSDTLNQAIGKLEKALDGKQPSGSYASQSDFTAHTASTVHMTTTEKTNLDSLATNISTISGITSTKVNNWDGAVTNSHTHSNKTYLDGITGAVGTMAYQNTTSYSSATQVNTALGGKSDTGHTHDGTYAKNAFSRITINTTNVDADSTGDTFTITSDTFVSVTGDATNDKLTIGLNTGTTSATVARGDHNHNGVYLSTATTYAGSSSVGGSATSAEKLTNTSAIGSGTQPVFFTANGVPSATTYSLNKTVPSDAVFTDTATTLNGHFSPTAVTAGTKSANASSTSELSWGSAVVTGVTLSGDAKGHITSVTVASGKLKTPVTGVTLASGTNNGTVKLTVNGSDTDNIAVKGLGTAAYKAEGYFARSGHTHTTTIASDTGTSQVSLTHGGKFKLTAGGTSYIFTMPSDNNSWRNVTVNGTEKLGTGTTTGSLDFASGSTNGTISVEGTDIKVTGLGGAAYLNTGTTAGTVATGNHNHSGTYATNAFSRITVNTTNVDADTTGDTFTISGGTFVTLTPDATADKMTIGVSTGTSSTTLARGDHSHDYSSTYAAKSHNHEASAVTAFTNYQIASSSASVLTTDSLLQVIGKLEKRIQLLETAMGGLKLVKISQTDYDNLVTKDTNTLYVIV